MWVKMGCISLLVSVSRSPSGHDLRSPTQGLGSPGTRPTGREKPEAFPKPGPREALSERGQAPRRLRWPWGEGVPLSMRMCCQEKLTPPGSPQETLSGSDLPGVIFNQDSGYKQHLLDRPHSPGRQPAVLAGAGGRALRLILRAAWPWTAASVHPLMCKHQQP